LKENSEGNMVKSYRIIVFISMVMMFTCVSARSETVDKIVAVVNDEIITQKELDKAFEPYLKKIEATYQGNDKETVLKQTKDTLLQRLVDNLLLSQEAKKTGTGVKDEEAMEVLKESLARQNISMEDFRKKLAGEATPLESIMNEIKAQLMRTRLMRREIKSKVMISDQEIGEYYNKHRDEYEGKEAVRIYQILFVVPKGADEATKTKIKNMAEEIQKRAAAGEAFDMLAARYSQGPEAAQGGDIGFIERGVSIPEVEQAAFGLAPNQVSSVIESNLGYHVIKVADKRGAGIKPMEAVREEIKMKLEDEKLDKKYEEWISELRKKSYTEIR
jgi:peptidyl-prolyl cis-trans isomerase SurA